LCYGMGRWLHQSKVSLPTALIRVDGFNVLFDRLVGFDDLGNTDDFNTSTLELQLSNAGKRI
jgi:hypothetical protein